MITAADLIEPKGDVTLELFPGKTADDLTALLTAYIADGYARIPAAITDTATRDTAAAAWVHGRVYRNVLMRLSRTPASVTLANEGGTTMLSEQIRTFKDAAARAEADFDTAIATAPTPDESPSAAARNVYVF